MDEMIDTDARIQINRDALKKIVKLTAESKIDKARIKELEGWIKDNCNHLAGCPVFWNNTHCNCGLTNLLKKDNHEAV